MSYLKRLIKRVQPVYRMASHARQRFRQHPLAGHMEILTGYRNRYWRGRNDDAIRSYWDNRIDRNRGGFLLRIVGEHLPESVLEIGCNCGNNLYALAAEYPRAKLVGIDINPRAVELGATWLEEAGIGNVTLVAGRAEGLNRFPDRSFDIVFSWATLIYPRPPEIRKILADMTRIARKAVVLLEVQSAVALSGRQAAGVYVMGHWKRDYVSLLTEVAPSYEKPAVDWIPPHVWAPGGGGGAVIATRRVNGGVG